MHVIAECLVTPPVAAAERGRRIAAFAAAARRYLGLA